MMPMHHHKRVVFVDYEGNGIHHEYLLDNSISCLTERTIENHFRSSQSKSFLHPVDPIRDHYLKVAINTPHKILHPGTSIDFSGIDSPSDYELLREQDRDFFSCILLHDKNESIVNYKDLDHESLNILAYQALTSNFHECFDICVKRGDLFLPFNLRSFNDLRDFLDYNNNFAKLLEIIFYISMFVQKSPFENISKFFNGTPFHTGIEMWRNYSEGFGGICAEKASSLKFLFDVLGIPNSLVCGLAEKPTKSLAMTLSEYINYPDSTHLPRIRHLLNLVTIGTENYLIDATGGNVPFLFLNSQDAKPFFQGRYKARMFSKVDHVHLYSLTKESGDALLLISEFHLPRVHWEYTFDQDLGLAVLPKLYAAAYFDYGGEDRQKLQAHFSYTSKEHKLPYPIFIDSERNAENCHSLLGIDCDIIRNQIRSQYWYKEYYTGEISIALQRLGNDFWRLPIVSREAKKLLNKTHGKKS